MTGVTQPRGALPARVYWIRRGVVLAVPVVLIFVLIKVLGGSDDTSAAEADTAAPSAARTTPSPRSTVTPSAGSKAGAGAKAGATGTASGARKSPLAAPRGVCLPNDVIVRPLLKSAYAAHKNRIELRLTGTAAACTFKVSHQTVALRITSGSDRIWSTQDCRGSIKTQDVVVRDTAVATVVITWSGRRSTPDSCNAEQAYAKPGFYHANASVIGGEPRDSQFEMTLAPRRTITQTVTPTPTPEPTSTASAGEAD